MLLSLPSGVFTLGDALSTGDIHHSITTTANRYDCARDLGSGALLLTCVLQLFPLRHRLKSFRH